MRCSHLDGKGKGVDYLKSQSTSPMAWSVVTSCVCVEMLSEQLLRTGEQPDGSVVFALSTGDAKVPAIYLDDYGEYVC
jgi:hypothetical protein